MTAFVDNDIIHKLCAFDLVDEALAGFGIERASVQVLPTARFKLLCKGNREKGVRKYGEGTYDRMSTFINSVAAMDHQPTEDDLDTLNAVLGIDQGEAILISAAAAKPASSLVTGDKKSIRALASAAGCGRFVSALRGRVVCFEQLVCAAIEHGSFEAVRQRVVAAFATEVATDQALRVVFGSGPQTLPADADRALRGYIDELRALPGGLLVAP